MRWHVPVGGEFSRALDDLAAAHRTSPFALLAAAVLMAQQRLGADAAGIVTDFRGWVLPRTRDTVGLFSHGIRIHLDRGGGATPRDALATVDNRLAEVRGHAVPLRPITAEWCRTRDCTAPAHPFLYVGSRPRRQFDGPAGRPRRSARHHCAYRLERGRPQLV